SREQPRNKHGAPSKFPALRTDHTGQNSADAGDSPVKKHEQRCAQADQYSASQGRERRKIFHTQTPSEQRNTLLRIRLFTKRANAPSTPTLDLRPAGCPMSATRDEKSHVRVNRCPEAGCNDGPATIETVCPDSELRPTRTDNPRSQTEPV